ncbi:MAG TPA: tetratricopeptide repeat protein [Kofleriaceae bacterium]|nr:tetratricopeptide repeat protein [Kofleriaceae bacterium]
MPEASIPSAGGFDPFEQQIVAGSEHLRQSRLADAQRAFIAALEAQPGHPKALALLGLTYFRGGNYAQARPVYEELVALLPGDPAHHLNLGLVYLKVGDADKAISELEKSRDLDPSQGRAVSYLGLAYARAGRFVEAYGAFLKAGQNDLAKEIEQHLTKEQRQVIEAALRQAEQLSTSVSGRFVMPTPEPAPAPAPAPAPKADAKADADEISFEGVDEEKPEPVRPPPRAATVRAEVDAGLKAKLVNRKGSVHPAEFDDARAQFSEPEIQIQRDEPAPKPEPPVEKAPESDAIPEPQTPQTAISQAVARAVPASLVTGTGTRVAPGSRPPQPLSELATSRLVRPEDGDHAFEISGTGVLVVRVNGKIYTRTEGVDVTGGALSYEPAQRRARGREQHEPFSMDGRSMFVVTGNGHLIASPLGGQFTAVQLDDDIFYLREDLVFAFEPHLRWENGHVPGSQAQLLMVQFRGTGAVAFRTDHPLLAVKLAPDRVLYVDAHALAGWIGRVVPRAVQAAGSPGTSELFVECTGEGVVLVQEETAPPAKVPVS